MKKTFIFTLLVSIIMLVSCSKDFLEIKPKGQVEISTLQSKKGVDVLLIGAYAVLDGVTGRNGEGWASAGTNWVWGGVCSDDAYKGSIPGDQNPINALEGFFADGSNQYVNDHWSALYDGVGRSNDVLRTIPLAADMNAADKTLSEAQAKFLRANFYFDLTMVHGKVPYINEKTKDPGIVPNDHVVWPEIEADLQFAVANLPSKWSDKGRATKWAAKTYLARAYMFQKKFTEAKALLDDVYTNGGFTLVPDFQMNYLIKYNNNTESIFEFQYAVNDGFAGSPNAGLGDGICGPTFMGSSGFYAPTHSLVSAFRVDSTGLPILDKPYTAADILPYSKTGANVPYTGPVDPRLDISIGRPGIPYLDWGIHQGDSWIRDVNNGGPYINKKAMFLKSEKGTFSSTTGRVFPNANNYRKFKLSHVILWLAECEAEAGSLHNATVLVNRIRNRAKSSAVVKFDNGTPAANYKVEPYAADFPTIDYARQAIRMEERLEFAMEGIRFFDLVRWGIIGPVMNNFLQVDAAKMGYLKGRSFTGGQHEIWPIPQTQIDLSKKDGKSVLTQNNGY